MTRTSRPCISAARRSHVAALTDAAARSSSARWARASRCSRPARVIPCVAVKPRAVQSRTVTDADGGVANDTLAAPPSRPPPSPPPDDAASALESTKPRRAPPVFALTIASSSRSDPSSGTVVSAARASEWVTTPSPSASATRKRTRAAAARAPNRVVRAFGGCSSSGGCATVAPCETCGGLCALPRPRALASWS